ncbi:NAD(P)-binding protein [Aspergillus ibericus CBS 121593]|uniref:NAD(P)-binding protein n=1 Tax=Aspergillus ibericus CBS 121593 TaxID=1448316 RepID=A0A395GR80_9EURO|nr:NAD(P)-binding protein [Aspergillus ibericus CBS 121593]RAK98070.1 NAD(P)-binding protein [Aspergillus ibericus CBS 121593]
MSISLVTGGSGYIGLHLVNLLLEKGEKVHTTVRSLKKIAKCQPLLDLQFKYPGMLSIFEADLMKDSSFNQAMQGCTVGTTNVLESVNRCESVQRVVLTSSIAAMYGDCMEIVSQHNSILTEDCWNETTSPTNNPYHYSKVIAERAAWKLQQAQARWDLVVINPALVLGPSLTSESSSGSLYMVENIFRGDNKLGCPELYYPIVDVQDVVEAHIRAGTNPTAKGRYIVAGDQALGLLEMADLVRPIHRHPKVLPRWNLPRLLVYAVGLFIGVSSKWFAGNVGVRYQVDNSKSVRELGISYRSAGDVIRGHYEGWLKSQDHR